MAVALVGGWFASAIIPNLVDKVTDYLSSNFDLHQDTKDLLEELTRTLMNTNATLDVVESSMMIDNQSLSEWLRKLKLTAYEAEDLIDTFHVKAIEATVKAENKVSNFVSSSHETIKNMLLPDEDLKQITKIINKLKADSKDIRNLINFVNLSNKNIVEKNKITDKRETISHWPDDTELIGREKELGFILDVVLDSVDNTEPSKLDAASSSNTEGTINMDGTSSNTEEIIRMHGENRANIERIIVIPIVGLGGVGKTALAQVVYNNQEVKGSFASCAWVCCSNNSDIRILMQNVIEIVGGNLKSNLSLEYLTKQLMGLIRGRKFLLVIDDVSKKIEDQWDILYPTLSSSAPRSVVILTTQNRKFANRVATLTPIVLDTLEWNKFLKLFYRHAFGNKKKGILESIAKSIAEKLHGLPLAAKIIGNLLRFKVDEDDWKIISKSEWWNMPEAADKILPSIGLTYQYLSPSLKQCFAFCSIFPKNYLFDKDRLVQMWIAHNFIQINNHGVNRLEDIGRQWFDKLVDYLFFQPAWDNSRYVMHDMMRDLAIAVSSDECFRLEEDTITIPQNVRHLAIETNDPEAIRKIPECKQLRTILYLLGHCKIDGMYDSINEILSKSKNVRVLDLSDMHMQNKLPPPSIQHLSHIRFLDLSSTKIELLSSSSFEHYHLQTLYLQKCEFKEMPNNISNLINLRHLYASDKTIDLIKGIGKLTNLQELNIYNIRTADGHRVIELKNMNEISGNLVISGCENIISKEEAMQSKLMNKKRLSSIEFHWIGQGRESSINKEILGGLEPHKGITRLLIKFYLVSSLPDWVMQINNFSNLKYFHVWWCVHIDSLPSLGQLPFLNTLIIEHAKSVRYLGDQFYGNTEIIFPSLNELTLRGSLSIEEWSNVQARPFGQNLSKVNISECHKLMNAPLLSFSSSLKELKIADLNHFISLSRCLNGLNSLSLLHLRNCTMEITLAFYNLRLLEDLSLIDCPQLCTEGTIQSVVNLKNLEILNCPNIFNRSTTDRLQEQKNKRLKLQEEGLRWLTYLYVDHNILHQNADLILGKLHSLQVLLYKLFDLNQFTVEQDAWFRGLTSLKELHFMSCNFEHLPASLTTLPALKRLKLTSCRNFISFPDIPLSVSELHIVQCSSELSRRCQPPDGDDWPKISHVSYIIINAKTVQNK